MRSQKTQRRTSDALALVLWLPVRNPLRQGERLHLLADDFRVKEWLGFKSHCLATRYAVSGKNQAYSVEKAEGSKGESQRENRHGESAMQKGTTDHSRR